MPQMSFPLSTFQHSDTTPIANGYLEIHLNKDCAIQGNSGQISSRRKVRLQLTANGTITVASQFWPNAELVPNDSVYIFSVYTQDGQRVIGPLAVTIAENGTGLGFGSAFGASFAS